MSALDNIFTPSPSFSIITVGLAFAAGVIIGLLLKSGIIAKGKKRILNLEDEMLSNHSRILKLEKEIADLKREKAGYVDREKEKTLKIGLRAS